MKKIILTIGIMILVIVGYFVYQNTDITDNRQIVQKQNNKIEIIEEIKKEETKKETQKEENFWEKNDCQVDQTGSIIFSSKWKIIESEKGDLNNDGKSDFVFILQQKNNFSSEIQQQKEFVIYFSDKESEKICKKVFVSDTFIPGATGEDDELDIKSIEIVNGILILNFSSWVSVGSWNTSTTIYKFKYNQKRKKLLLIGYDMYSLHRGSGDFSEYSINFLSKKMSIKKGNISNEEETKKWKSFELEKLKSIEEIEQGWEFEGLFL